jgi:leader peptidase (prepilin peptidase)/N-methyltransferase
MTIILGVFGLFIGSFLNVVIYRVPKKISIVSPPSRCPKCRTAIRPIDNIPVFSWLKLQGKCRACGLRISIRYPLVEITTAAFFALVGSKFSHSTLNVSESFLLLAFLYLAAISIALAMIDIDTHTLPNWIVLPSYGVGVVFLGIASATSGSATPFIRAILSASAMWVGYLVIALSYPGGMGFGDVKFAGVIGLFLGYLGWSVVITGAVAAFVLGALFAIGLLLKKSADRKSGIPFGPWMMVGAWVAVLFSAPIVRAYLSLVGLDSNV